MTETNLTAQAPWYVSGARTRFNAMPVLQIISEPTGEVLALVPYSDRLPEFHAQSYADARLIAAAPDLLTVAEYCLAMVEEGAVPPDWDWVRTVIAKAAGREALRQAQEQG